MSISFNQLRIANATRQAEWDVNSTITPSFRGLELAGEIGELCNVIKKLERIRLGLIGNKMTREELIQLLKEELGDGVICLDLIAMDFGIDLGESVQMKFNLTSNKNNLLTRL